MRGSEAKPPPLRGAAEAMARALSLTNHGKSHTSVRESMMLGDHATNQQFPLPLIACPLLMDRADILLIDGANQLVLRATQAQESAAEWLSTRAGVRCVGQR